MLKQKHIDLPVSLIIWHKGLFDLKVTEETIHPGLMKY